jgi:hypothetical protein
MSENLTELRKVFNEILKEEENPYKPYGITGDPDCPYRDWRGTPLEVGATVVYPGTNYSNGTVMKEGVVVDIIDKPEKKQTPAEWKFMVRVEIQDVVGKASQYRKKEIQDAFLSGKPKRQGIVAVEKITVVF